MDTKTLKQKLINKLDTLVENITNKLKEGKNNDYNKFKKEIEFGKNGIGKIGIGSNVVFKEGEKE